VDADLRAAAIATLPDRVWETYARPRTGTLPGAADPGGEQRRLDRSLLARAVLYTAWHALLGAILVCGAVLSTALILLALGFAAS